MRALSLSFSRERRPFCRAQVEVAGATAELKSRLLVVVNRLVVFMVVLVRD